MSKKNIFFFVAIVLLIILLGIIQTEIDRNFNYPFKPIGDIKTKEASFVNFWGVLLGNRRLSADLAWINLLQYYGTREDDGKNQIIGWGEYKELFPRCQAVIRLDPYFRYAYLYGGAALAFNQERFDEAVELLKEGVENYPQYWQFHFYLGAIGYLRTQEYHKVIPLLEKVAFTEEAPTMLRSILANIYEKQGEYRKAELLWEYILNTALEEVYIERAKKHLEKLKM